MLRVQLAALDDATWTDLRALAREAAQFCNAWMADAFASRLGYQSPDGQSVFRRAAGRLSAEVRNALSREAFTQWRMHGGKILSGAQRLAQFDADRALVCRAGTMSKGRRRVTAQVTREGDRFALSARLVGKHVGGPHTFVLMPEAHKRSDEYLRPVLMGLAAGEIRLLKVSLVFERPGRSVFALLTYEKHLDIPGAGAGVATLGPLEPDGSLWLRWEVEGRARSKNYTHVVHRLAHMKTHFHGIQARLKRRLRRGGPGWTQDYRRALVKAGSFGHWAHGPLHELSADVVRLCRAHGVGTLQVAPLEHQDLPMAELVAKLTYKCQDHGLQLTRLDPVERTGERALKRPVAKSDRRVSRARAAMATLREVVAHQEGR